MARWSLNKEDVNGTDNVNNFKDKVRREIIEWTVTFVIAFLVFLLVQKFICRNADVSGDSMTPTLMNNDKVIINLTSYIFEKPKKGDIIVFPYKENPKDYFIKRVIGLPGDVMNLTEGKFYINEEPLDDEFSYNEIILFGDVEFPVTVPEDSYFVLGDNRNGSLDSRSSEVGFIKESEIAGKAGLRIWPLNKIGIVK